MVNTEPSVTPRARTWLVRAGSAVAVAGSFACRGDNKPSPSAQAAGSAVPGRSVPVQTAPVTKEDLPIWLEGLGNVAAFQQVTVRAQVDGRLDKVLFTEGQQVK